MIPYLNRKTNGIPEGQMERLPKMIWLNPQSLGVINARGQDRESLIQFMTTIAQTMGPEAMMQYILIQKKLLKDWQLRKVLIS